MMDFFQKMIFFFFFFFFDYSDRMVNFYKIKNLLTSNKYNGIRDS